MHRHLTTELCKFRFLIVLFEDAVDLSEGGLLAHAGQLYQQLHLAAVPGQVVSCSINNNVT